MADENLIKIQIDESTGRADKVLAENSEIQSRTRAAKLIEDGHVSYSNGALIKKPSEKLKPNTELTVRIPIVSESSEIEPYEFELDFLHEDDDIIIVNKPAGLVVHPAAGHEKDTLVNALVYKVKDLSMGFGENRPGIVHRLDKDTSGILVVAKNDFSQQELAKQFKEKSVHRIYNAIVYGKPKEESGTEESSLIRHPVDRKKYSSERGADKDRHNGKWAVTHYKLLTAYSSGLSLIECQLETGRTHQIRVHLSEKGHPLIGDNLYGSEKRAKNLKSTRLQGMIRKLERIGLHARELGFKHPRSGEELMFKSDWPQDMVHILEFLRPES